MIYVGSESEFNAEERNLIIRYAISIGTRARCATLSLLRPLAMKDLCAAFKEKEQAFLVDNRKYEDMIAAYEPNVTELSASFIEYFDGVPTKQKYADYYNALIKQNKDAIKQIRKFYQISVCTVYISKELLSFHRSLNPRVTFGYSSLLHEECDFELDEGTRQAFLSSSLSELPVNVHDLRHDFGYVTFGERTCLYYEDLCVYVGDRCILDTMSHESDCSVDFTVEELEGLAKFHENSQLCAIIADKLKNALRK